MVCGQRRFRQSPKTWNGGLLVLVLVVWCITKSYLGIGVRVGARARVRVGARARALLL